MKRIPITIIVVSVIGCLTLAPATSRAGTCSDTPAWSAFSPGTTPSARWHSVAVWDSVNARMIVHGGWNGSALGDVWSFSPAANAWTQLSPSGTAPSARSQHAAIYDPVRQRMVMLGGYGANGTVYALSLGASPAWSTISTSGSAPNSVADGVAVYDRHRDRLIFVQHTGDTYALSFATNAWSYLNYGGNPVFGGATGIYDPVNQRVLLYGGYDYATPPGYCLAGVFSYLYSLSLNPLGSWQYLGSGPSLSDAIAVFDPQCSRMVLYGGTTSMSCSSPCNGWPYDTSVTSGVWSVNLVGSPTVTSVATSGTSPAARSHHVGVYDPALNRLISFGGGDAYTSCTYRNDTHALKLWDVTTPSTPAYFNVSPGCVNMYISWQATGDDANRLRASHYELRHASYALNESNFNTGTLLSTGTPELPGAAESYADEVGECSSGNFYALKVFDHHGNASGIVTSGTHGLSTPCPPPYCWESQAGEVEADRLQLSAPFPNPAKDEVTLHYTVPFALDGADLEIAMFDITGRRMATLVRQPATAGRHVVEVRAASHEAMRDARGGLRAGVYYVKLRIGPEVLSRSLLIAP